MENGKKKKKKNYETDDTQKIKNLTYFNRSIGVKSI